MSQDDLYQLPPGHESCCPNHGIGPFKVEEYPQSDLVRVCCANCNWWSFANQDHLELWPTTPVVTWADPVCICDRLTVVDSGCRCGAFEAEQEARGLTRNPITKIWERKR